MYRFAPASVHRCSWCEAAENRHWAGDVDGNGAALMVMVDKVGSRAGTAKSATAELLAGLTQQDRAQVIVGLVSERELHATAGLMLKALLP